MIITIALAFVTGVFFMVAGMTVESGDKPGASVFFFLLAAAFMTLTILHAGGRL